MPGIIDSSSEFVQFNLSYAQDIDHLTGIVAQQFPLVHAAKFDSLILRPFQGNCALTTRRHIKQHCTKN